MLFGYQAADDVTTPSLPTLLKQRLVGLSFGYEDLNDHDALRRDP